MAGRGGRQTMWRPVGGEMTNSLTATSMPCTMPGVVRATNLTLPWAGETSLTCPPGLKTKASSHKAAFIFLIYF